MKRELLVFGCVGVCTVAIDYLVYLAALQLGLHITLSKGIGFVAGSIFSYFANRLWTFSRKEAGKKSALKFAALYLTTLGLNNLVNYLVFHSLPNWEYAKGAAFLMATGVSTVLNFMGMKFFVFRSSSKMESLG